MLVLRTRECQCHAMPFSARALKKNIFFGVDMAVKQIEMWFVVVCTLTDNDYSSLLVSQAKFSTINT